MIVRICITFAIALIILSYFISNHSHLTQLGTHGFYALPIQYHPTVGGELQMGSLSPISIHLLARKSSSDKIVSTSTD